MSRPTTTGQQHLEHVVVQGARDANGAWAYGPVTLPASELETVERWRTFPPARSGSAVVYLVRSVIDALDLIEASPTV